MIVWREEKRENREEKREERKEKRERENKTLSRAGLLAGGKGEGLQQNDDENASGVQVTKPVFLSM